MVIPITKIVSFKKRGSFIYFGLSYLMISIAKEGHEYHAYFRDYWRLPSEKGVQISHGDPKLGVNRGCFECHRNGPIALYSQSGKKPDTPQRFEQNLSKMNDAIAGHKSSNNEIYHNNVFPKLAPHGPLDQKIPTREKAFIEKCSGLKEAESLDKITNAMKCSTCHDGKKRAPIYLMGSIEDHFINKLGAMPPRNRLTESERKGLTRCLKAEYVSLEPPSVLLKWLTQFQSECEKATTDQITKQRESIEIFSNGKEENCDSN